VAFSWQKTWEISGRSGKIFGLFVLHCGKSGKHQEETSSSSGITRRQKMTLRPLGAQVVVIFCGISNCRLVEIFDLNSFTQVFLYFPSPIMGLQPFCLAA
jgi:hypothetical protein